MTRDLFSKTLKVWLDRVVSLIDARPCFTEAERRKIVRAVRALVASELACRALTEHEQRAQRGELGLSPYSAEGRSRRKARRQRYDRFERAKMELRRKSKGKGKDEDEGKGKGKKEEEGEAAAAGGKQEDPVGKAKERAARVARAS